MEVTDFIQRAIKSRSETFELQSKIITKINISDLLPLKWLKTIFIENIDIENIDLLVNFNELSTLIIRRAGLNSNQLEFLSHVNKITHLDIGYNEIEEIDFLKKNSNLEKLGLAGNKVKDISPIIDLHKLHYLNLHSTLVERIDEDIYKRLSLNGSSINKYLIEDLKYIAIRNQQYEKAADLRDIKEKFENNEISGQDLDRLNTFFLDHFFSYHSVIHPPREILRLGYGSVLNWYSASKKELDEIKILLVGDPKTGKTSLLKRLADDAFDDKEAQTDGINIKSVMFKNLDVFKNNNSLSNVKGNFWDFGGQEIMSATHQLFLTKRSVYLLLLDSRNDKSIASQIKYWMKIIQTFGGNSPVIIIGNKIDVNPGFGFENEYELREQFPQIASFVKVSAKNKENLAELIKCLGEAIEQSELLNIKVDDRWILVKDILKDRTRENRFLNESSFIEICRHAKIQDKKKQRDLIQFLNDIGVTLYFEELGLREYFVLDPHWITYGLYQIITSNYAAKNLGEVNIEMLEYIVNEEPDKQGYISNFKFERIIYSYNERRFLVDVLCLLKLCYYTSDRKHFILPDLLPTVEPSSITQGIRSEKNTLQFIYEYDHLPKSVFPAILVSLHKISITSWRTGCVLSKSSSSSLITTFENRLSILVIGEERPRRDFMSVIRYIIDSINYKLNLSPLNIIPLPDNLGFANYDELLDVEIDGKRFYQIYRPTKRQFEISMLLEGFSTKSQLLGLKDEIEELIQEGFKNSEDKQNQIISNLEDSKELLHSVKNDITEIVFLVSNNQNIVKLVDSPLLDVSKLEKHFEQLSHLLENIITNPNIEKNEIIFILKNDIEKSNSVKEKFKITWSLLPTLLTELAPIPNVKYETEIGFSIRETIREIISDFKNGYIFIKP